MSLIQSIELYNYESFSQTKLVFDESNILNIKGYNDSGKSAILRAIAVCLMDMYKNKQVGFIKHGKDYFRVVVTFDDGVSILRDKYRNGQSLYEMYLNGELQYSTKQGDRLSKVVNVPDIIANYLNLCVTEDVYLNYQGSRDPLPVVDYTGSKNYKMFHEVFRVTEISRANAMINTDRNDLNSTITILESNLNKYDVLLEGLSGVSEELVDKVSQLEHDACLYDKKKKGIDECIHTLNTWSGIKVQPEIALVSTRQLKGINSCVRAINELQKIKEYPVISSVDSSRLRNIGTLSQTIQNIDSVKITPKIDNVDTRRLKQVSQLRGIIAQLDNCKVVPSVELVDEKPLKQLKELLALIDSIELENKKLCTNELELDGALSRLKVLETTLKDMGDHFVKCDKCGNIIDLEVKDVR